MKRLILFLMIILTTGILPSWSGGVVVYRELTKMDTYQPQTGDRLIIPNDACAVDMRYLDHSVTISLDVSQANPNCLYYLNAQNRVPEGLDDDRLIIRSNDAGQLYIDELIVDSRYSFMCTESFKAAKALFIYTPRCEVPDVQQPEDGIVGSGTLVLPFDVDKAWLLDVNETIGVDAGFTSDALSICRFVGFDGRLKFQHVDNNQLSANQPYLINSVLPSRIAFYSENVTVPQLGSKESYSNNGSCFWGYTMIYYYTYSFCWDYRQKNFLLCNGDNRPAFSALITIQNASPSGPVQPGSSGEPGGQPGSASGGNEYPLEDNRLMVTIIGEEKTTGISTVASRGVQRVYTLSGQRLSTSDKSGLRPGIYIIGGRKVVVK